MRYHADLYQKKGEMLRLGRYKFAAKRRMRGIPWGGYIVLSGSSNGTYEFDHR